MNNTTQKIKHSNCCEIFRKRIHTSHIWSIQRSRITFLFRLFYVNWLCARYRERMPSKFFLQLARRNRQQQKKKKTKSEMQRGLTVPNQQQKSFLFLWSNDVFCMRLTIKIRIIIEKCILPIWKLIELLMAVAWEARGVEENERNEMKRTQFKLNTLL